METSATIAVNTQACGLLRSRQGGPLEDRKVVSLGLHNQKDFYKPKYNEIDIETVKFHVMNGDRHHDVIRSPRSPRSPRAELVDATVSPRPRTTRPVDTDVITGYVVGKPLDKEENEKVMSGMSLC